jgi:hypothetical protein
MNIAKVFMTVIAIIAWLAPANLSAQSSMDCANSKSGAKVTFLAKEGQIISLKVDWNEGATFMGKINLALTNATCEDCPNLGGLDRKLPREATYTIRQTDPSQPVIVKWGGNAGNIKFCGADRSLVIPADNAREEGQPSNTLEAGQTLNTGAYLMSANGAYILFMQEDGNLCVYKSANGQQGDFVWGSMKYGFENARLDMQTDGNLVVYDGDNKAQWASETHPFSNSKFKSPANKPVKLVLENDGNLKLYTASGTAVWSSK